MRVLGWIMIVAGILWGFGLYMTGQIFWENWPQFTQSAGVVLMLVGLGMVFIAVGGIFSNKNPVQPEDETPQFTTNRLLEALDERMDELFQTQRAQTELLLEMKEQLDAGMAKAVRAEVEALLAAADFPAEKRENVLAFADAVDAMNRVAPLTGALTDLGFAEKLVALKGNLQAMKDLQLEPEEVTRALALSETVTAAEKTVPSRFLTMEERLELLKEAVQETYNKYDDRIDGDYDTFISFLAGVFSETCDDVSWNMSNELQRKHKRSDLVDMLNSRSMFDDFEEDDRYVERIVSWISDAHEAGEDFPDE